jgi:hypothetical protein
MSRRDKPIIAGHLALPRLSRVLLPPQTVFTRRTRHIGESPRLTLKRQDNELNIIGDHLIDIQAFDLRIFL